MKTSTFDNGVEFSRHEAIAQALDTSVYFADSYASWQPGLNENLNGFLRQYFPKRMSFEDVTPEDIDQVETFLNLRG